MAKPPDAPEFKPAFSQASALRFGQMGVLLYFLTSIFAILGVVIGYDLGKSRKTEVAERGFSGAFAAWDGQHYLDIVDKGYQFDPDNQSNVAFFPAYPVLGKAVVLLTGMPAVYALLLVSHVCLAAVFFILACYLYERFDRNGPMVIWSLLALGLLPTTYFFRMAYSESLFLLLSVLCFFGMQRKWPLIMIALLIGLACASRSVGVVLLAPFLLHLISVSSSWKQALFRSLAYGPLALWGLVAYMIFQWCMFDNALAFVQTQIHWRILPAKSAGEKAISLVTLEPIWTIFSPTSKAYWRVCVPPPHPAFSLYVANPFYFVATIALVTLGGVNRWLNGKELLLSAGLLLVPYATKGPEMGMISMGRFAAIVFPAYFVMGIILARMPKAVSCILLLFSGLILALYSMFYSVGHLFYF